MLSCVWFRFHLGRGLYKVVDANNVVPVVLTRAKDLRTSGWYPLMPVMLGGSKHVVVT